jgi:glucan phosphoethanolaminetransferase (alkaline phosphatase superfamily)
MLESIRKFTAGLLILAILFFSALAILSIWDIIQVEQVFRKSLLTLVVIFCAAIVILFVFSNFFKDNNSNQNQPPL